MRGFTMKLIRIDFGTNRVEKTREQWTLKLIQREIESLDSMDNNDHFITHLLKRGFKGYDNFELEELIEEIQDALCDKYDIDEEIEQ
jgi:hypothetical protein